MTDDIAARIEMYKERGYYAKDFHMTTSDGDVYPEYRIYDPDENECEHDLAESEREAWELFFETLS